MVIPLKLFTAEGQFELTHNTSQATSWQLGHLKPTFPHNHLVVEDEMKWVSFVFSPHHVQSIQPISSYSVWPVPKPFSRGFLHCVPLAPGSLCDWLLGLVVAGSLLPCNAHNWATSSWQSWKWQAAGEGFKSDVPRSSYRPPTMNVNISHDLDAEICL